MEKKKSKWKSWWVGLGALLLGIGTKLKSLLPLLKLGKFGGTFLSMLISVGAYALLFPWQFAIGFVILIFIHEMGHVWAAKQKGLPVSAPTFIPFVGALITMKHNPQNAKVEAYIAFGGPLIGTLGALACYGLGVWMENPLFFGLAWVGFFLNLFNLLPIHPLDGGRIVKAITRWLWVFGFIASIVLIIYLRSFVLLIILLLFIMELWGTFRPQKKMTRSLSLRVPSRFFYEQGVLLPGEDHRRELPFRHYCDRMSQEHRLEFLYPGLGTLAQTDGVTAHIHKVELVKTEQLPDQADVQMELQVTMTPMDQWTKEQEYYQISAGTRWLYGVAYLGLGLFLGVMMWLTHGAFSGQIGM